MFEADVKQEYLSDLMQCRTCLRMGRKLYPLVLYVDIFKQLFPEYHYWQDAHYIEKAQICWECRATLLKMAEFQTKVLKATEILQMGQECRYGTLSNLVTVIYNDDGSTETNYLTSTKSIDTNLEIKNFQEDTGHDNKEESECNIKSKKTAHIFDGISNIDDTIDTVSENDNKEESECNIKSKNTGHISDSISNMHCIIDTVSESDNKAKSECNIKSKNTGHISDGISNIDDTMDTVSESANKEESECKIKRQNSKWVEEKVLFNKQPKFKIIKDYKKIFRKVKISQHELKMLLAKERDSKCYKARKYKCESCVLTFKDKVALKAHVNRYHIQAKGPYTCDICESHIKKSKLKQHIFAHYFKYMCVLCAFSCNNRKNTYTHRNKHRQVFQCVQCKVIFGGRREFFKHFKQWHEKYVCDYCGVSFKMRYSIEDHIRKRHLPYKCKPCDKTFMRRNGLWMHNKVHHSSEYQASYCVECDRWYAHVQQYRWHLTNSTRHVPRDQLKNPCPGCDKVFTKKIYMKNHYNFVHLKKYNNRCEECDKNFLTNCTLVRHKKRVHEGILPPKDKICYFCGRGFATNKVLKNHIRTHTGERPYVCQQCPAAFAQRTPLMTHIRARHSSQASAGDQRRVGRSGKRQN